MIFGGDLSVSIPIHSVKNWLARLPADQSRGQLSIEIQTVELPKDYVMLLADRHALRLWEKTTTIPQVLRFSKKPFVIDCYRCLLPYIVRLILI